MNTKRRELFFGAAGLLLGLAVAGFTAAYAVNTNNRPMIGLMGMHLPAPETIHHNMTMEEMVDMLNGKAGDSFDEAFIAGMIEHHQGALDMAALAQAQAKHQEVKDLAADMINSQTKEIAQMRDWQIQWGYQQEPPGGMNH